MIIESNVAMPTNGMGRGRPFKYPFRDMAVGDSFAIHDELTKVSVANAASGCSIRTGMKFSVRKHEGAWRCWRIK